MIRWLSGILGRFLKSNIDCFEVFYRAKIFVSSRYMLFFSLCHEMYIIDGRRVGELSS